MKSSTVCLYATSTYIRTPSRFYNYKGQRKKLLVTTITLTPYVRSICDLSPMGNNTNDNDKEYLLHEKSNTQRHTSKSRLILRRVHSARNNTFKLLAMSYYLRAKKDTF